MLENNQKELILLEDLGMIEYGTQGKKARYGIYRCACGKEFKANAQSIKTNHTRSCGCLVEKHGLSRHRLYKIWTSMINRCNNQKSKDYKDYGAKGIIVCKEWLDINRFIEDMYPSYTEGLSLDRINTNGNYERSNCRWTTQFIQSRNTRLLKSTNTSGYRGVCHRKDTHKYRADIRVNNKRIGLGCFNTAIEAAKAYDNYVILNNLEHTRNFS